MCGAANAAREGGAAAGSGAADADGLAMRRAAEAACRQRDAGLSRREAVRALTAGLGLGVLAGSAALARAALGSEASDGAGRADEPPAWATFSDAELAADLDGDGTDETIELRDRRLAVRDGRAGVGGGAGAADSGDVLLETPEDWQVSDVLVADFDGDGALEVVFLLWRHGNFGSSRPFWLSESGDGADGSSGEPLTQHLFMYRWRADRANQSSKGSDAQGLGRLHPVWMSSRLGIEIAHAELLAGAGVAAGEGPEASAPVVPHGYRPRLRITSADGDVTLWEWLSWGFALVEDEGLTGDAATPAEGLATAGGAAGLSATGTGAGSLTLLVVGDMIAHPNIYEGAYDATTRGFDFAPLFARVREHIAACDLAAVCQETPLVENPARRSGYPLFATPQSLGDALAGAGFDIVLGATNHANDQGPAGIDETTAFWAREHPEVTLLGLHAESKAAGGPTYLERNGICLALFDYTYGLNGRGLSEVDAYRVDVLGGDGGLSTERPGEERLLADVAAVGDEADLVVCFLHIGEEYDSEPTAYQCDLVERLVDAGAGAVICSHTHVLGPYGRVRTAAGNEGVVFYGLGNFVSGQCDDIRTILGGAAVLHIERAGSPAAAATPATRVASPTTAPTARVSAFELEPLVCHTSADNGSVAAYFLDDYSDELATTHVLGSLTGAPLTTAALRALVPTGLP